MTAAPLDGVRHAAGGSIALPDFRAAVALGAPCTVEAWVASVDGRNIWAESELHFQAGDRAQARGLYVEARHVFDMFDKDYYVPRL